MGRLVAALFFGFFAVLAIGAIGVQIYGITGRHERRAARRGPSGAGRELP